MSFQLKVTLEHIYLLIQLCGHMVNIHLSPSSSILLLSHIYKKIKCWDQTVQDKWKSQGGHLCYFSEQLISWAMQLLLYHDELPVILLDLCDWKWPTRSSEPVNPIKARLSRVKQQTATLLLCYKMCVFNKSSFFLIYIVSKYFQHFLHFY